MSQRSNHPHFEPDAFPTRQFTFPGYHTLRRHKPRRWPLVLRVTKGSVHSHILLPVFYHTAFTCLIVYIDLYHRPIGLSGTVIPSLSIVVGLMLVFRNGTSYDRFWAGRNYLAGIVASSRNLARTFLVCSRSLKTDRATEEELMDTETVVRLLIAVLYSVKHHLRSEFAPTDAPTTTGAPYSAAQSGTQTPTSGEPPHNGGFMSASTSLLGRSSTTLPMSSSSHVHKPSVTGPIYTNLLRHTAIPSLEARGVCLPFQLSLSIEAYIRRGLQREWWIAPQAASLQNNLSSLLSDFACMDTIRSTPMPVAHLIHTRQVLALYLMALPFALIDEMAWWSVAVITLVSFTLYGIEGIGRQLEDPFGYDKNDIKMDAILLDAQEEVEALLEEWRAGGGAFN
jgi:putative membrane protein